jgi:hypothetical protein
MKITSLLTLIFTAFHTFAQLDPFLGIVQLDVCDFTDTCTYVEIPEPANNLWVLGESQKNHPYPQRQGHDHGQRFHLSEWNECFI